MNDDYRFIYPSIISASLSTCIIYPVLKLLNYRTGFFMILLISFIFTLFFYFIRNRKFRIAFILFLIVSVIFYTIIAMLTKSYINLIENLSNFISQTIGSLQGTTYIGALHEYVFSIMACFIISFIIYFFVFDKPKFLLTVIIISLLFWIHQEAWEFDLKKIYVFCFYCFIAIHFYFYSFMINKLEKNKYFVNRGTYISWVSLLSIYVFFTALFFNLLFSINIDCIDGYKERKAEEDISSNVVLPYDYDSSKINSESLTDNLLLMTVFAHDTMYLRGRVKNIYEDGKWLEEEKIPKEIESTILTDSILFEINPLKEILKQLPEYDRKYDENKDYSKILEKYYYIDNIQIKYNNILTNVVVTPLTTQYISLNRENEYYFSNDETIISDSKLEFNKAYNLTAYILKRNKYVEDLLRDSKGDSAPNEYLIIKEDYKKKLKPLAQEITEGAHNTYDKLKAIDLYLSNNYSYNIDMEFENQDFLEEFLFDKKGGYCVQFASAFVLLARSIDIPTRYVEGFVLYHDDVQEFELQNINNNKYNTYQVKGKHRHAFPEAYIEGFGWVMFEPTPSYSQNLYSNDTIDGISKNNNIKDMSEESKDKRKSMFLLYVSIIIIAIVLFNIFKKRSNEDISNSQKAIIIYGEILKTLEYINIPIKESETVYEFINHKRIKYNFMQLEKLIDITDIFVKARYSQEIIDDSSIKKMQGFYEFLVSEIKKKYSKKIYYNYLMKKIFFK